MCCHTLYGSSATPHNTEQILNMNKVRPVWTLLGQGGVNVTGMEWMKEVKVRGPTTPWTPIFGDTGRIATSILSRQAHKNKGLTDWTHPKGTLHMSRRVSVWVEWGLEVQINRKPMLPMCHGRFHYLWVSRPVDGIMNFIPPRCWEVYWGWEQELKR